MPRGKKRSPPARKKRRAARPTRKQTARTRTSPRKAASKKVRASRKAAPTRKPTAKQVVAPGKVGKTGPRRRPARPAKADLFVNPQQQLTKVQAEPAVASMSRGLSEGPPEVSTMPVGFFSAYTGAPLTEQDFADAAQLLGCEVPAVKAVAEVETAGAGFDASNRPRILYERHIFAHNTVPPGKFNSSHPDLSASEPGGYGKFAEQYGKLARALQLDPEAALKAPSWGKFQILGANYKACGFASVTDFVRAMTISEREHLKAFVKFVQSSPNMLRSIRDKAWATFARAYNGPGYAKNQYDTKLAAAYTKHGGSA